MNTPNGSRSRKVPYVLGKLWRASPLLWAFGVAGLVGSGRFHAFWACGWTEVVALAGLLAALAIVGARRVRRSLQGSGAGLLRDDLELGFLLLSLAEAVALLGGGVQSPLYPTVYLVMAFLVAFLRPAAGVLLTGAALGLELLAFVGLRALPAGWPDYAAHAGFLTLFALLYQLVLAAQIVASRRAEGQAVARRLRQFEERAHEYRLIASGSEGSDQSPEGKARWVAAAVREVEQAVGSALEVAELSLRTHTCAVFLLSSDDRTLKLHDCRSRSDALRREPFDAGEGLLGGVVRRRQAVRLTGDFKGINYYERSTPVKSVLAVPLVDRRGSRSNPEGAAGFVRGVLVADRFENRPFDADDEALLAAVGREVLRSIEVERVMGYVKRARDEKDRFYRAMEDLNRTAKPDEVFEAALEILRTILPVDFAAITLVEDVPGRVVP